MNSLRIKTEYQSIVEAFDRQLLDRISDFAVKNNIQQLLDKISQLESEKVRPISGEEQPNQAVIQQLRPLSDESNTAYYNRALSILTRALRAHQACLYLVRDTIALASASYACDVNPTDYAEGEGLIGQTMVDKKLLVLNCRNKTSIQSGLGNAFATSMMIAPCISGNKLSAILEFNSFREFSTQDIAFINRMTEALAPFIEGIEHNEIQERQLNIIEEIRREMEIREQVFGQTTILSESDPYGSILYVNDKLCEVSGYSRDELIGQPHSIFRHPDMPKEAFRLLWQTIKSGNVFKGIVKNKSKSGGHYWVEATIVPITDQSGNIVKYVSARFHIRYEKLAQEMFDDFIKSLPK